MIGGVEWRSKAEVTLGGIFLQGQCVGELKEKHPAASVGPPGFTAKAERVIEIRSPRKGTYLGCWDRTNGGVLFGAVASGRDIPQAARSLGLDE